MAKQVYVTGAEKRAAQTLVERSAVTGRFVSDSVRKIANAQKSQPAGHLRAAGTDSN